MGLEHKLIKCESDSPRRCQAVVKNGQCPYTAIEGESHCGMHLGNGESGRERKAATNYRLTKWQARLNEFANADAVKSLRDEIGILRLILEETMNRCQDGNDLIIYSSRLSDLAIKIEKLVNSCHRLELSTGTLLDKQSVLQLAANLVEIMTRHIPDQNLIDQISEEILTSISTLNTVQAEIEISH